ncbi:CDP-alcohol phosphatidyltransferase family protein [soil metagenome]
MNDLEPANRSTRRAAPIADESAPPVRASRALITAPNALSAVRLALVPLFVTLYLTGREDAAIVIFVVGASSDFVDGYVARRTNSVTELGKLLDPLADRAFIGALASVLVIRGLLDPFVAGAVVARDAAIIAGSVWLARRGRPLVPVSLTGKAATACLLIGLTWLALAPTDWRGASLAEEAGNAFIVVGGVLYYAAGALYVREALRGRPRPSRADK